MGPGKPIPAWRRALLVSSTRRLLSPEPASSDFHLSPCCPGIEGSAFSSTELWASLDAWVSRSASEREREARPVSAKLVDRCFTPEYKAELSELECDMWCSGYHIVLLDCLYCWRCINGSGERADCTRTSNVWLGEAKDHVSFDSCRTGKVMTNELKSIRGRASLQL